jgi:signal transduction histidine kinase
MVRPMASEVKPPAAVHAERERLASVLHAGIIQQITALSLAIDSAMLHAAEGDADKVSEALRTARRVADLAIADCRALLYDLRHGDP